MKFSWKHCEVMANEINLRWHNEPAYPTYFALMGWVCKRRKGYGYNMTVGNITEARYYHTKLQAMRALRRAAQVYIIGGGKAP